MLAALCVVIAGLYFARDVLVPLTLAILLTFLLSPALRRLERLGLHRAAAMTLLGVVAFTFLGLFTWVLVTQLTELAGQLPEYQENIIAKVRAVRQGAGSGTFKQVSETIHHISEEAVSTTAPSARPQRGALDDGPITVTRASASTQPIPVRIVPETSSVIQTVTGYLGSFLGPLGTGGIVIVFSIFMLIHREDLRDRIIRLVGAGHFHLTTEALDDATTRISHYLSAQALINGVYGVVIVVGLSAVGATLGGGIFPNVLLWGLLCALLRFMPYIGIWIAASFPCAIALAVYPGFSVLIAVIALFLLAEVVTYNVVEPLLYGASTGMSTLAILVTALFWTWLWGPIGLLLATPLTVCLVVIGKHVPQMAFLDILLGDQPVLEPHQRVYQRLLAGDQEEATELLEQLLEERSLENVYEEVVLPALAMAEHARHSEALDEQRGVSVRAALHDVVGDLADQERAKLARNGAGENSANDAHIRVICLPANDEADEIVGTMLLHLLELRGYEAMALTQNALASEMVEKVEDEQARIVCISALPPAAITHARYLCKRLYARFPDLNAVIGLWTFKGDLKYARSRIGCSASAVLTTTLAETMRCIAEMAQTRAGRPPLPARH